jgi:hypothetical protein
MTIVTLEQMRKTGPSKGIRHHVEENQQNHRTVQNTLDALAVDLSIIVREARSQEEKSWKGDSVRNSLRVLHDLERRAEQAVSLLTGYMGEVTFIEEAIPEEVDAEACV